MVAAAAAAIAIAQAAYQAYKANQQKKMADKLKPSNYVPNSVREATDMARMDANATMGPTTKRGLEKLRQSTATSVENAKRVGGSPGQIQQAVADIDAREKETIKDLQVADSVDRYNRRQDLGRNLQVMGQYERMSRDAYNAAKSALRGASEQNKYNAVTNAGEGIMYSLPDNSFSSTTTGQAGLSTTATRAMADTGPQLGDVRKYPTSDLTRDTMGPYRRRFSSRYPASIDMNKFDYRKYLSDLNMKRFATGY